jgi:hypothetical protein
MKNAGSEKELTALPPVKKNKAWISWLVVIVLGVTALISPRLRRAYDHTKHAIEFAQSN